MEQGTAGGLLSAHRSPPPLAGNLPPEMGSARPAPQQEKGEKA